MGSGRVNKQEKNTTTNHTAQPETLSKIILTVFNQEAKLIP